MLDFVYKLDLPPLDEILLDHPSKLIATGKPFKMYKPDQVLNPHWLNWDSFTWTSISVFFKPDHTTGTIHTDTITDETLWGINWIWNGSSIMEYWLKSSLPTPITISDCYDNKTFKYTDNFGTLSHDKIYHLSPGAYLVNASMPHRATGTEQRYAVSLRDSRTFSMSWNSVIEKFNPYIVKWLPSVGSNHGHLD